VPEAGEHDSKQTDRQDREGLRDWRCSQRARHAAGEQLLDRIGLDLHRGRQRVRRCLAQAAELRRGTAKQHQRARQPAAVSPSLEDIDRG
jgi:predicted component of type VI protein secretion system